MSTHPESREDAQFAQVKLKINSTFFSNAGKTNHTKRNLIKYLNVILTLKI